MWLIETYQLQLPHLWTSKSPAATNCFQSHVLRPSVLVFMTTITTNQCLENQVIEERKKMWAKRTSSGVSFPVVAKVETFEVFVTAFEAFTIISKSFSFMERLGASDSDICFALYSKSNDKQRPHNFFFRFRPTTRQDPDTHIIGMRKYILFTNAKFWMVFQLFFCGLFIEDCMLCLEFGSTKATNGT